MNGTRKMTATAALLLALGGGVVGGMLAVAGVTGSSPSGAATYERTNEESTVPTTTATPDVDSLESELGYPVETAEPAPAVDTRPVVPTAAPVGRTVVEVPAQESASEAAERAKAEADRAEREADRAEQSAPKPAPTPSTPSCPERKAWDPKPGYGNPAQCVWVSCPDGYSLRPAGPSNGLPRCEDNGPPAVKPVEPPKSSPAPNSDESTTLDQPEGEEG